MTEFLHLNPSGNRKTTEIAIIRLFENEEYELNAVNETFCKEIGKNEIFLHSLS
jgi:hypothetical protein